PTGWSSRSPPRPTWPAYRPTRSTARRASRPCRRRPSTPAASAWRTPSPVPSPRRADGRSSEAGDADDGVGSGPGRGRVPGGVALGGDGAVAGRQPDTLPAGGHGEADHRMRERLRVPVGGVAVGHDGAVVGDQGVPVAVPAGHDADDLLLASPGGLGAEETGVAVVEHPAVGGDQPVAVAAGG